MSHLGRRQWLKCAGAVALTGGFLQGSPESAAATEGGLWLEWTDGRVYRHQYVIDKEGLWLDEHDGFMCLYEDFEVGDEEVSLKMPDGTWQHYWGVADEEAEESLTAFHYV